MTTAKYIVIDGLDGSGKGSVIEAVKEVFPSEIMFQTKEPGGTPVAGRLRDILLFHCLDPLTEMFIFLGARNDTRRLVGEQLENGVHVLSDRSDSSTYAFQIYGRELFHLEDSFFLMNSLITPYPSLYIFLELPAEIAQARVLTRASEGGESSRFDKEEFSFHERVSKGFRKFSEKVSTPCIFVDASRSKEKVAEDVIAAIRKHIEERATTA